MPQPVDTGPLVVLDADAACVVSPPPQCSQNPSGQVVTRTLDAFTAAISARWVLCGTESVFGKNGGDAGLEITSDGHWYKLYPAVGGGLVRGAGFDQEGTWDTVLVPQVPNDPQPFQLNLYFLGGGYIVPHPALAATPRAMRLNNNGVFSATYVLLNVPVGTVRCGQ
jgi:hypothetical protein